ncbi:MAG: UDP-N-acetylmuramate--L-alanine ligase [Clostridium sp.]|nr:UDP-N-acetylmuramate--L-alanine ligase [Clostridium sp.]
MNEDLSTYRNIYFVGAGGIGMAALERYFLSRGKNIAGYDRTPSDLTAVLRREGVAISYDDNPSAIPAAMTDPADTLVVYTPAVGEENRILNYFRDKGFTPLKRARVLGLITRNSRGLCFAGTHGKTTTSSMAAHILHQGSIGCNAFLGGILRNYDSNLLLSETSPYSVIEADEYDRSFHQLTPWVAVITATDPDHLDIYGTEEAYLESFRRFTSLIRPGGALVVHTGLKLRPDLAEGVRLLTYSRDSGDYHAEDIRRGDGEISFTLVTPTRRIRDIRPGVPVEINIENTIAAMAALDAAGILEEESARRAMASFMGPKRRFEFWLKEPGLPVLIDDYAHHPDELRASIASVRALYPGRRLTVAFQPHLYSRTRDFAPEFAAALSAADDVVLLDIYPAREEPIEGVTAALIYDRLTSPSRTMASKENLAATIASRSPEVVLTAGAGDISTLLPAIAAKMKETPVKC